MRKWLAILLAAMLLLSVTACGGSESTESDAELSSVESVPVESDNTNKTTVTTTTVSKVSASGTKTTAATTTAPSSGKEPGVSISKQSKSTSTSATAAVTAVKDDPCPSSINSAILWNGQHSSYDAQAETLRQSILITKDTVKASTTGKTYYVSYKGNDANDGLTPATAWRSTKKVGAMFFSENTTILFERGGVYRGMMKNVVSGMSIGAYGSGQKPQLYGGARNYADESLWLKTKTANVWRLHVGTSDDIGNIVFDHGKECSGPGKKLSAGKLAQDYDFYHDTRNGYIYLYLSKGNPGKLHESIEVTPIGAILNSSSRLKNVTIDNLCLKYANFGIAFSGVENITITNCEIGWIGGCYDGSSGRWGNGIELFAAVNGATIKNNWIYQCYDAGYTNQDNGNRLETNIVVSNNLIEYCNYNIEVFVGASKGGKVTNSVYEKNHLRFAGYGFGSYGRYGDTSQVGHIRATSNLDGCPCENFIIRNNVFDCSAYQLVNSSRYDGVLGPKFTGNTWIQNDAENAFTAQVLVNATDSAVKKLPAKDQATMEASVAIVDKEAKVIFEKKK